MQKINYRLFNIFNTSKPFDEKALEVFRFQAEHCLVYKQYLQHLKIKAESIDSVDKIPLLPISFFKTHQIISSQKKAEKIFSSSATTGTQVSQHFVSDIKIYEQSFTKCFEQFYGTIDEYCIVALLPNYLERSGSSLVYMVEAMMKQSNHPLNGFYLYDFDKLKHTLLQLELAKQKTLLIGVTYALLDFAVHSPIPLSNTIIMETGGMKGRKKEMLRSEVQEVLCQAFHQTKIHSEYGMTELLSQAYSSGDGLFECPSWMKIIIKDMYDPFQNLPTNNVGQLGVIDLANINSCSFIATDDLGVMRNHCQFEVLGRKDNSDVRGCNLMVG